MYLDLKVTRDYCMQKPLIFSIKWLSKSWEFFIAKAVCAQPYQSRHNRKSKRFFKETDGRMGSSL